MRKSKKKCLVSLLASIAMLSALSMTAISASAATENNFTINDATKIQKHLVGMIQLSDDELARYDVNKDGAVTVNDVTAIQQILSKCGKPVVEATVSTTDADV